MFNKIYDSIKNFIINNYKFLIAWIIIVILFFYELPYVIYTPGGIVNLEERIVVDGEEDVTAGSLNMSYVSLVKGTIPMLLLSFVVPNWDILPSEEITREDESVDELLELEKLYMKSSIDNATILAFREAGKELNITREVNNIVYIADEAETDLEMYDELLSVDEKNLATIDELRAYVNTLNEGDTVSILVNRDGKEKECSAKIYNTSDGLKVGISFLTTYEYETTPEIEVTTKNSESGSSGGLMLSLAIYNAIADEDITKGRTIVGTGTIDINGNVGEIDGVKYKLLGANKNNAEIFLCPMENYEEALEVKEEYDLDVEIHGVATFSEALEYLMNN
ncbi:MAG TPA: PDZ domain-containing protein [Candidatus Onthocola stercorigallinarum]|nr:PDZ domain-containing protein [Candidatus Onthocola stercorigallinarum]